PADGELAPAFVGEAEDRVEDVAEERLAEEEPADQRAAEEHVDDRRLQLDEGLVVQPQRQPAEDDHHDCGDERHHRQVAGQREGDGERDQRGDDERRRGEEDRPSERGDERPGGGHLLAACVGDEEEDQRPHLERDLEERVQLLALGFGFRRVGRGFQCHPVNVLRRARRGFSRAGRAGVQPFSARGVPWKTVRARPFAYSPTSALAKSSAANGSRSSTPSPIPMKCTGRPYFAAIATRMPPRAMPSSLVITSPVTPARLPKISTWLTAFWPVVASSVKSTEWGAAGSTLRITRMIFSSSAI